MPRRGANSNTLSKFTPKHIHNKVSIDIDSLKAYFYAHTLSECALRFCCSSTTIKRKLRNDGVDTSIHNHSLLAKSKSYRVNSKLKPSKEKLKQLFIDINLDTKTIAEQYGLHYNTIRQLTNQYGLSKSRHDIAKSMMARHARIHGYSHPSQRPDVMEKTRRSAQRVEYNTNGKIIKMRSLHELSYALYLDRHDLEWYYEEMRVPYVDNMSGKWRIYVIDFTVIDGDDVRWIEVKPNNKMIPNDKRIYASRRAEEAGTEYRGLTADERREGFALLCGGYNNNKIKFLRTKPRSNAKQISYYLKSKNELERFPIPHGWKRHAVVEHSECLMCLKLRKAK